MMNPSVAVGIPEKPLRIAEIEAVVDISDGGYFIKRNFSQDGTNQHRFRFLIDRRVDFFNIGGASQQVEGAVAEIIVVNQRKSAALFGGIYNRLNAIFIKFLPEILPEIITDGADKANFFAQFRQRQGGVGAAAGEDTPFRFDFFRFDIVIDRVADCGNHS